MSRSWGEVLAIAWGATYASWAGLKTMYGLLPTMCEPPPIASVAGLGSMCELIIGLGVCSRATQRIAAIAGVAMNLGLIAVAFIADARGLPWQGCRCVFVGVEFPWLPGHAVLAGALVLPFLAVVARSERLLLRSTWASLRRALAAPHARNGT